MCRNAVADDRNRAGSAWREELRHVKARIPRGVYGGLTWSQLEKLIATYRAGRTDLGAFLLAQEWQRALRGRPTASESHRP